MANSSPVNAFPDKQGKYREFLHFEPRSEASSCEKARPPLRFFAKFPTQRNREIFRPNRELNLVIRELSAGNREEIHMASCTQSLPSMDGVLSWWHFRARRSAGVSKKGADPAPVCGEIHRN